MQQESKIKNQKSKIFLTSLLVLLSGTVARSSETWHLTGWSARAVIEISKPAAGSVDTAVVKVYCQGRGKPDASDYRVLDMAGNPIPFQLTFHNASRYSLIAFRASKPTARQRFYVYFGNGQAQRAQQEIIAATRPGSGAPKADWIPRAGLVFQTIQRPDGDNPETVESLEKLISGSQQKYGARYQTRVSDGHNPFGRSDYYISVYRGWINIPKSGTYKFCTASNEASFSFLDGKKLVHWPGRHTSERGARGEKNETIELTAGLHHLEYYHEETTLKQVAFLGWSPPGSETGHFAVIPESVYQAPHHASVVSYESPSGPLLYFEPDILDSIWPDDRHEGQYTRVQFRVGGPNTLPNGTTYRWDFGDGHSATGTTAEHVYLSLGQYDVSLTAQGSAVKWPLEIYELQHVTDDIKQGRPPDYAKIASQYDPQKLDAASLKELAHLFAEADMLQDAIRSGKIFIERFAGSHPKELHRVRRLIALCALETGEGGIDEAIANFQASITDETPATEKIDSIAQLIRLLGIERKQPENTEKLLKQVEETAKNSVVDETVKAAYRRAVNAAGDVELWHGRRGEAYAYYKRVEALRGRYIPAQVRAARVGAFPNAIREYLAIGNYGAALQLVDRWEDRFATEKVKGQTFYWRGTILTQRKQYKDAARYLARAIALAVGAGFETEARWRLAHSLEKLGRKKEAKVELARLVATGLDDNFTKMAREKLEQENQ